MPEQICPICDQPNDDSALECIRCGKQLADEAEIEEEIEPVAGLEVISVLEDTRNTPDVERLETVEDTMLPAVGAVALERVAIEPTVVAGPIEVPADPLPVGFELGREAPDEAARTLPPEEGDACPWCGHSAPGKICDNCGRRKGRYSAPVAAKAAPVVARGRDPVMVHCKNCLSKVIWAVRCAECGVPMEPIE